MTAQSGVNLSATSSAIAPRISQPATSSMAAAPIVSAAVRVCESFSSMKMRPRMGIAVIDIATAKKRRKPKAEGFTVSGSRAWKKSAVK